MELFFVQGIWISQGTSQCENLCGMTHSFVWFVYESCHCSCKDRTFREDTQDSVLYHINANIVFVFGPRFKVCHTWNRSRSAVAANKSFNLIKSRYEQALDMSIILSPATNLMWLLTLRENLDRKTASRVEPYTLYTIHIAACQPMGHPALGCLSLARSQIDGSRYFQLTDIYAGTWWERVASHDRPIVRQLDLFIAFVTQFQTLNIFPLTSLIHCWPGELQT